MQSALKNPSADITPGYEMVTVKLRDGNSLRGFARSRNNFDIRVEDLQGNLHLLEEGQIASIAERSAVAYAARGSRSRGMQEPGGLPQPPDGRENRRPGQLIRLPKAGDMISSAFCTPSPETG